MSALNFNILRFTTFIRFTFWLTLLYRDINSMWRFISFTRFFTYFSNSIRIICAWNFFKLWGSYNKVYLSIWSLFSIKYKIFWPHLLWFITDFVELSRTFTSICFLNKWNSWFLFNWLIQMIFESSFFRICTIIWLDWEWKLKVFLTIAW